MKTLSVERQLWLNGGFNFLVFLNVYKRCLMQASLCFKMEKFLNKKKKTKACFLYKKASLLIIWNHLEIIDVLFFKRNWSSNQLMHTMFSLSVYRLQYFYIYLSRFSLKIMLDKRERHKPIYQAHSLSVKACRWNNILSIVL